jgi:hypothetical protein
VIRPRWQRQPRLRKPRGGRQSFDRRMAFSPRCAAYLAIRPAAGGWWRRNLLLPKRYVGSRHRLATTAARRGPAINAARRFSITRVITPLHLIAGEYFVAARILCRKPFRPRDLEPPPIEKSAAPRPMREKIFEFSHSARIGYIYRCCHLLSLAAGSRSVRPKGSRSNGRRPCSLPRHRPGLPWRSVCRNHNCYRHPIGKTKPRFD